MCYSRYRRIQSRSREQWTAKEDRKICEWVKQYGCNWDKISDLSQSKLFYYFRKDTKTDRRSLHELFET